MKKYYTTWTNILFTVLYPFVTPVNFVWDWGDYGLKNALDIERKNLESLCVVWSHWRDWLFKQ